MAVLDTVADFEVAGLPVGQGALLAGALGVASGAEAIVRRLLGQGVSVVTVTAGLAVAAFLAEIDIVKSSIGARAADTISIAALALAIEETVKLQSTIARVISSVSGASPLFVLEGASPLFPQSSPAAIAPSVPSAQGGALERQVASIISSR